MPALSDYLLRSTAVLPGLWVRVVNNATAVAYVSDGPADANGKFTFSATPPIPGTYTMSTSPTGAAPWTATGDTNYLIPVSAGDDAALKSLTVLPSSPYNALDDPGFASGGFRDWGGAGFHVRSSRNPSGAAKGDGQQVVDASITSGQTLITSASGLFKATDTGKKFSFYGAGAAGAYLNGILTYVSATTATSSVPAGTTVASGGTMNWGTDDGLSLQAAHNATQNAALKTGGVVLFGTGVYMTTLTFSWKAGVKLKGNNSIYDSINHQPTVIRAFGDFATPANGMVNAYEGNLNHATSWMHWATIEDMAFDGSNVPLMVGLSCGQFGEVSGLRNVTVIKCPDSGIILDGNQAVGTGLENLNVRTCGFGVNIRNAGFVIHIKGLSGDDCSSLLRVNGGISTCVTIEGFKSEAGSGAGAPPGVSTISLMDPVILVDSLNGGLVQIVGGIAQSDDSQTRANVVKIQGATANRPQISFQNVYANFYTNMLNDTVNSVTVPVVFDGYNRPYINYNCKLVFPGNQGGVVLQEGATIRAIASNGSINPIVNPTTSDNLDLSDPLGTNNAVRSLSAFTYLKDMRRSNQTVAFSGGTAALFASQGERVYAALSAATTVTIGNAVVGQQMTFVITHANNATVFAITWPANVKFAGGTFGTSKGGTQTANSIDTVTLEYDGTNWNEVSRAMNCS